MESAFSKDDTERATSGVWVHVAQTEEQNAGAQKFTTDGLWDIAQTMLEWVLHGQGSNPWFYESDVVVMQGGNVIGGGCLSARDGYCSSHGL